MKRPKKLKVNTKDFGQRLDIFLSRKLKNSRSQAQKMIEKKLVTVDGKLPKKAGDKISGNNKVVTLTEEKKLSIGNITPPKNLSSSRLSRDSLGMTKIINITPDYIIVEKPAGMLTHPTMAKEKNTLAQFLTDKYPEIKKVGETSPPPATPRLAGRAGSPLLKERATERPGIVHRLDKEASGLLVIARTQAMFENLKQQFKNRTVNKEYLVLVHGKVAKDWGEINFPIRRSRNAQRMAAVPASLPSSASPPPRRALGETGRAREKNTKEAKTEFWVEKRFVNFTLLKVKIHTGRMHQIRAHFFAYGNPVVGDPLYFQKKQKRLWDEKLGRLFLHCTKLSFIDLDDKKQIFESKLPIELNEFLKIVK